MPTEIELFFRQALNDPASSRNRLGAQHGIDPGSPQITRKRKHAAMRKRIEALMVLMFNEPRPFEQLSLICGQSPEHWRKCFATGYWPKPTIRMLVIGLQAHLRGLRDHLHDVETEVRVLTDVLSDRSMWGAPEKLVASRRRSALKARSSLP